MEFGRHSFAKPGHYAFKKATIVYVLVEERSDRLDRRRFGAIINVYGTQVDDLSRFRGRGDYACEGCNFLYINNNNNINSFGLMSRRFAI